jgi:hypothetical protein
MRILRLKEDEQERMERNTISGLSQFVLFMNCTYCKDNENEMDRTCSIHDGEEEYI